MKKCLLAILVIFVFSSCVSAQERVQSPQERASIEVIGRVNTEFSSWQIFHIINKDSISRMAYSMGILVSKYRKI